MVRLRRKLLRDTLLLGAALTLAAVAADQGHGLSSLENWAYDRRARAFQFFTPPPTDKLVHLDIDDNALNVIGRWPWSRSTLAELMNEIHLAGPKVVAMDIVFSEPDKVRYEPIDPTRSDSAMQRIDPDALLTEAFKRCGNVIVPVTLGSFDVPNPIDQAIESFYRTDLEADDAAATEHLAAAGFSKADISKAVGHGDLLQGRRSAAYSLVRQALFQKDEPLNNIESRLLKSLSSHAVARWNSATTHLLEDAYTASVANRTALRFAIPLQVKESALTVEKLQNAPLDCFGQVVTGAAFVDHDFAGEAVVRDSALLIAQDQRAFLQLGLALACKMLNVDLAKVRVETDRVILPLPPDGKDHIDIPVRTVKSLHNVPAVMYIPWFGTGMWETMYDWPDHREKRQHFSMNEVWEGCLTRHKIEANNRNIDDALFELLDSSRLGLDPQVAKKYFNPSVPPADQFAPRRELARLALSELQKSGKEKSFAELAKLRPLSPDESFQRDGIEAAKSALAEILPESEKLEEQADFLRLRLHQAIGDRAVLIGLAPSSSTADVVTTSLHNRTPGVVVHGTIFNAILTRHFWKAAPAYVTILLTLLAGFATAVITVWLSPVPAMLLSVLLLSGYVLLNGLLFFDHYGLIVGLAGPCVAITIVWAGCAMLQTIIEARERALITRRFQQYVDPALHNYYMENPKRMDIKGEMKELTVVFTDLANFTKMAEKLGEKSVELLNRYMGLMVPIIRRNSGYLNKFLGDGIMFFYGAPMDNPEHARDAVATALTMQQAMAKFNAELVAEGLPELGVRAGISTGRMVVGDAGSSDASDYTVLGDAVNLGARLESANKYLGTRILMTARTAELAKDKFIYCPIGKLRVVGKTEGVFVFEGVVPGEGPNDVKDRIQLTTAMIRAYQAGEFAVCIVAAEELVERFAASGKLAALYHEVCQQYLRDGAPADFDGSITLAEK
jgi:class 3 adenylate cyclase/CHASE2 domain-containing sensor protein